MVHHADVPPSALERVQQSARAAARRPTTLTAADAGCLLRTLVRDAFPASTFRIHSKHRRVTLGRVLVGWTDGPSERLVRSIVAALLPSNDADTLVVNGATFRAPYRVEFRRELSHRFRGRVLRRLVTLYPELGTTPYSEAAATRLTSDHYPVGCTDRTVAGLIAYAIAEPQAFPRRKGQPRGRGPTTPHTVAV